MSKSSKHAAPRTKELEFGGKLGAPFMILGLPFAVYALNLACSKKSCQLFPLPDIPSDISGFCSWRATYIFFGWFLFHVFIALLPIGELHQGLALADGTKLKYRCNGFIAMILSLTGFCMLVYLGYPVHVVYDEFLPLATVAILFSFVMSVYLYIRSFFAKSNEIAIGGNSGNVFYDFFIGRELNPRIGALDLKFFCELRPGLIGWVMLDLCFIMNAFKHDGHVPPALALVSLFHAWYVADALWFEEAILTTMDIVHDGFGFMLAFGDLAWVPFLYSLQARFLLEHPQNWPMWALGLIFVLHCCGYVVFRGSNSQKNNFRKNPNDPKLAHLEAMSTASGRKLLVSGWWGLCRHPNYLGDLMMAFSWSLPSGFTHILPYFYPIYFLILLIHRNMRDEVSCQKKYGHDWAKYCKYVPYRIFPGLF